MIIRMKPPDHGGDQFQNGRCFKEEGKGHHGRGDTQRGGAAFVTLAQGPVRQEDQGQGVGQTEGKSHHRGKRAAIGQGTQQKGPGQNQDGPPQQEKHPGRPRAG